VDKMTAEQKNWIDNASFLELLYRWQNASSGDEMFIGETTEYYFKVMKEKRTNIYETCNQQETTERSSQVEETCSI
jgi:hypothetical protein